MQEITSLIRLIGITHFSLMISTNDSNYWLIVVGIQKTALCQQVEVSPGESIPLTFCTYPVTPGIYVDFQIRIGVNSGYHQHDDPSRPGGVLSSYRIQTNFMGCVTTTYYTPGHSLSNADPVAGGYMVVASIEGGASIDDVTVISRVPNLVALPTGNSYTIDPPTAIHPMANYGTSHTISVLQQICNEYFSQTAQRVRVNDISLPLGGRFDLGSSYNDPPCTGLTWKPCHFGHTNGLHVDIPGLSNRVLFTSIASQTNCVAEDHGVTHLELNCTY